MPSKKNCITSPETIKGQVIRAADPAFEQMLAAAGASIAGAGVEEGLRQPDPAAAEGDHRGRQEGEGVFLGGDPQG
jgi:hypothetical protein